MYKTQIKNATRKLKQHAPELMIAGVVVTSLVLIAHVSKAEKAQLAAAANKLSLTVPPHIIDRMRETGELIAFDADDFTLLLKYVPVPRP